MKAAFPPIIDIDSTILILGTMPGEESLRRQQYYANKGNSFWKLIFAVFNTDFITEFEERKAFLKKHHIALWDVLASCERSGSLDSNIKNETANDFDQLLEFYPNIRYIVFSSKAAEKFYGKYANRKNHISYKTLPSPSGANASMTFLQKLDQWQILATLSI